MPKTEPDTVCISMESTHTSNISLNHAQHANVTAHKNHKSQPTLAPEHAWQLLSTDYFQFDGSEYLIVTDYYCKMPIIRRIPVSQCQCLQGHLSPEGTLYRTWHPRGTPCYQWPPVCQCIHHCLQQTGSSTITPAHLGILEPVVKLKQPSRPSKDCSPVPSPLVKTHTLNSAYNEKKCGDFPFL